MNTTLNNILKLKIEKAISESDIISKNIEHKYLAGKHKEIVLGQLIRPILPHQYDVGTGKVCDSNSFISRETDIIIYSKRLIQPLIFEHNFGMFPIESVLSCIEVKSVINQKEYTTTFEKFEDIRNKVKYTAGSFDNNDNAIDTTVMQPTFEIFSFNSNLKNKTNYHLVEFNRYKKVDNNWNTNPVVRSICIVNRGWWIFWLNKWHFHSSLNLMETILYLVNNINTLSKIEDSRGNPRLGNYLAQINGLKEL